MGVQVLVQVLANPNSKLTEKWAEKWVSKFFPSKNGCPSSPEKWVSKFSLSFKKWVSKFYPSSPPSSLDDRRHVCVIYYDQIDDQLESEPMYSVSVAEAKARLSEILSRIENGDEVVITRRGRPVARLAAFKKPLKPVSALANFRAGIPMAKKPATKMIRQMRDEGY
jgi:prevent-host-death family protein